MFPVHSRVVPVVGSSGRFHRFMKRALALAELFHGEYGGRIPLGQ